MTLFACPIACPVASLSKMRTTWMSPGSSPSRARSAVHLCTSITFPASRFNWPSHSADPRPRGQQRWRPKQFLGDPWRTGIANPSLESDLERMSARLVEIAASVIFFPFITGAEANDNGGRP